MPRYNHSRNPTCANNVINWAGPSWTRITGQTVGSSGRTTAGRVTVGSGAYPDIGSAGTIAASNATAAGQTISYVAAVRSSVARDLDHFVSKYNGTAYQSIAVAATRVVLSANTWTTIRGTGTVSAGGTYDRLGIHLDLPTGAAGTLDVSLVRIELGISDSALAFADGDSGGPWSWDGTAGSSSSTRSDTIALLVRSARSASTASRPVLTQRQPIAVRGVRSAGATSRALLGQRHFLPVRAARAASRGGQLTISQRAVLVLRTARANSRGSRPLVTQTVQILVRGVRSATTAGRPILGQILRLRSTTRASRPLLTQRQPLSVRSARAAPRAGRAQLGQRTVLAPRAVRAAAAGRRVLLAQRIALIVSSARSAPQARRPQIAHRSVLAVRAVRAATRAQRRTISQRSALVIRQLRSASRATAPKLTQLSRLYVTSARAATRAVRAAIRFRPGRPVAVPTAVRVAQRGGAVHDSERFGQVAVTDRRARAVANVRGRVTVAERAGFVRQTTDR